MRQVLIFLSIVALAFSQQFQQVPFEGAGGIGGLGGLGGLGSGGIDSPFFGAPFNQAPFGDSLDLGGNGFPDASNFPSSFPGVEDYYTDGPPSQERGPPSQERGPPSNGSSQLREPPLKGRLPQKKSAPQQQEPVRLPQQQKQIRVPQQQEPVRLPQKQQEVRLPQQQVRLPQQQVRLPQQQEQRLPQLQEPVRLPQQQQEQRLPQQSAPPQERAPLGQQQRTRRPQLPELELPEVDLQQPRLPNLPDQQLPNNVQLPRSSLSDNRPVEREVTRSSPSPLPEDYEVEEGDPSLRSIDFEHDIEEAPEVRRAPPPIAESPLPSSLNDSPSPLPDSLPSRGNIESPPLEEDPSSLPRPESAADRLVITTDDARSFIINGKPNPFLSMDRGKTYTLEINTPNQVLWIKTKPSPGKEDALEVENNGMSEGELILVIDDNTPNVLFYVSEKVPEMGGVIVILPALNRTDSDSDSESDDSPKPEDSEEAVPTSAGYVPYGANAIPFGGHGYGGGHVKPLAVRHDNYGYDRYGGGYGGHARGYGSNYGYGRDRHRYSGHRGRYNSHGNRYTRYRPKYCRNRAHHGYRHYDDYCYRA